MHDVPLQVGTCVAKPPSLIVREPAVSGACAPGSKVPGGASGPEDSEPALPPDDAPPDDASPDAAPPDDAPPALLPADASVAAPPLLGVPPAPDAPPASELPPDARAPPLDRALVEVAPAPRATVENRESSPLHAVSDSARMIQPQDERTADYCHQTENRATPPPRAAP